MKTFDPIGWARGGGLARRLLLLFVLAAGVPLALSDWLSSAALVQIADGLSEEHRARATRQVSRQVFDRLLAGKTLLQAVPAIDGTGAAERLPDALGSVFLALTRVPPNDTAPASPQAAELLQAWREAVAAPTHRAAAPAPADRANVQLRWRRLPGAPTRVFLGRQHGGHADWVAEVNPEHLWQPVDDAGEDGRWQVADAGGQRLYERSGADYRGAEPAETADSADAALPGAGETRRARTRLFLDGELGAADWVFEQRFERPQPLWQGQRLSLWLALTASATLLLALLLGRWQIVHAVEPLRRLSESTRRLAGGERGARVAVQRDDEIGTLAGAFNEMAGRIESQLDAMQGLAAIDRAILAGAPMVALVALTLERLAALSPNSSASVCWRASDGTPWCRHRHAGAADAGAAVHAEPRQARLLDEVHDDQRHHTGHLADHHQDDDAPGDAADRQGLATADAARLVLLPLRLQGRTEAVIVLGNAHQPPWRDEQLSAARELRDRLAVALAARAREQELQHRAAHDSLTGLLNRYGLNDNLDTLLAGGAGAAHGALLLFDLDHFKDINDSRGHDVGDELLCLASQRLREAVPAGMLVARQGGDEFALVAQGADAAQAETLAAAAIAALGRPFDLRGAECLLSASVGIALFPAEGWIRDDLLRCADVALYAAKAAGRNRFARFTRALDQAAVERVRLLAELRQALEHREFVVHYQPRVSAGGLAITSAEALIRWQHPERGLLYPDSFIGQAEASGLIDAMGLWILEATCAQIAAWRREGVQLERVSVNVSPRQFASGQLVSQVRAALARHGVPGHALELEVTESLLVGDVAGAAAQLAEMRALGVSIALDDFGTGYSSMSTLHQLPIDVIKIDRSFVRDLGSAGSAVAVVHAIVSLARSLDLRLVAEGVETALQAEMLGAMGCGELQGYLYSRPVAIAAFGRLPGLPRDPRGTGVAGQLAELGA